ncbi:hypothetical protein MMC17_004485 [Xylographa soralifera]|nr:hypothetical protein [Xylographa soralifera]
MKRPVYGKFATLDGKVTNSIVAKSSMPSGPAPRKVQSPRRNESLAPGICGILRITNVADLNNPDLTFESYLNRGFATAEPTLPPIAVVPLGEWTFAKLVLGIILDSIPPCRALFVRTLAKSRGKSVTDEENTLGVRAPSTAVGVLSGSSL